MHDAFSRNSFVPLALEDTKPRLYPFPASLPEKSLKVVLMFKREGVRATCLTKYSMLVLSCLPSAFIGAAASLRNRLLYQPLDSGCPLPFLSPTALSRASWQMSIRPCSSRFLGELSARSRS